MVSEPIGSLIVFVIALLIGGLAIYISTRLIVDVDDYSHAVVTALVLGISAFGIPGT